MIRARGYRDGACDGRNRDRHGAIRRGAVAELAVVVVAPALNRAIAQQRAAVRLARGYRDGIGDARNRDGHEAIRRGAVTELAVVAVAPALNRASAQQRAVVNLARGNRDGVGDARDRDGHGAIRRGAVAELAVRCCRPSTEPCRRSAARSCDTRPAATAMALVMPETVTGTELSVVVPLPSWPS